MRDRSTTVQERVLALLERARRECRPAPLLELLRDRRPRAGRWPLRSPFHPPGQSPRHPDRGVGGGASVTGSGPDAAGGAGMGAALS